MIRYAPVIPPQVTLPQPQDVQTHLSVQKSPPGKVNRLMSELTVKVGKFHDLKSFPPGIVQKKRDQAESQIPELKPKWGDRQLWGQPPNTALSGPFGGHLAVNVLQTLSPSHVGQCMCIGDTLRPDHENGSAKSPDLYVLQG
jgi:hypothetical protein